MVMTQKAKKKIYNLNLFILIITIGFFMYWQKTLKNQTLHKQTISLNPSASSSNFSVKTIVK